MPDASGPGAILGVDVGGTFTDAVLVFDGRVFAGKAASTPGDQSEGALAAAAQVLEKAGMNGSRVSLFAHGMTVATNALLEGKVAVAALVATRGFADVVEIGRQNRPSLYRLDLAPPPPHRHAPVNPHLPCPTARGAGVVARPARG